MNGTWQEIPDPPSSAEVLEAEKRIKELLPAAIATLKGVHTVECVIFLSSYLIPYSSLLAGIHVAMMVGKPKRV